MSTTLNEEGKNETWGFRDFYISVELKEVCSYFYSECNYEGQEFKLCEGDLITSEMSQIK